MGTVAFQRRLTGGQGTDQDTLGHQTNAQPATLCCRQFVQNSVLSMRSPKVRCLNKCEIYANQLVSKHPI